MGIFDSLIKTSDKILNLGKKAVRFIGKPYITTISTVASFLSKNELNAKSKAVLNKFSNFIITKIHIVREVLNKAVQLIGNIATKGGLDRKKKALNYDDLYHTLLGLELTNGSKVQVEKLQVASIREGFHYKGQEQIVIPERQIKLYDFIQNGIKAMGKDFYTYNVRTNNCQRFVVTLLRANGINNFDESFVTQKADTLLSDLDEGTSDDVDALLNVATAADGMF